MKLTKRTVLIDYIPALLFFCAITVLAIITRQMFIKVLPCLLTLVIMMLCSNVNRWGYILAVINNLIYAVGFAYEGLYGSVASCILLNVPACFLTFVMWSKYRDRHGATIRKMNAKQRLAGAVVTLIVWAAVYFITVDISGASDLIILDSLGFALSLIIIAGTMFAFMEAPALNILSCSSALVVWCILTARDPKGITYLLVNIYNLYRVIIALYNHIKLYNLQKADRCRSAELNEQLKTEI